MAHALAAAPAKEFARQIKSRFSDQRCRQISAAGVGEVLELGPDRRLLWRRRDSRLRNESLHFLGGAPCETWGIASSRLPVALDRWDAARRLMPWLAAVKQTLCRIRDRRATLMTVDGATGDKLLRAVATPIGINHVRAKVASSWNSWLRLVQDQGMCRPDVAVSPPLDPSPQKKHGESAGPPRLAPALPLADQLLWGLADRLEVLYIRAGGAWDQWLESFVEKPRAQVAPVVSVSRTLADLPQPAIRNLLLQGGVCRVPLREIESLPFSRALSDSACSLAPTTLGPQDCQEPLWERMPTLIHWTRVSRGPWPGESWDTFWMRLLLNRDQGRSAFDVLRRIVGQRRLLASSRCIRGQAKVVCFTSLAPDQWRPQYRRHRRQSDGGGYGVAINRRWLAQRNARPVIYGDERLWGCLAAPLRPFFQMEGANQQWRNECEWRLIGDAALAETPPNDIELIVPSYAEAKQLQQDSPWRVRCILPTPPID